uniref:basic proline-rich protein-like n=1 Tax=Panthera onca TaxID=9690 RepID=UPI002953FF23|nr:basic proline-rich protein-like [Panthera onca]XP_060505295.1 basic proline-rich protein-like [Panthera onca]XP_060505296.1 basic proline-rich protein-like [Panthera onca]XP_060505297.1 basic proline-rich protein-like [Panthera onca]
MHDPESGSPRAPLHHCPLPSFQLVAPTPNLPSARVLPPWPSFNPRRRRDPGDCSKTQVSASSPRTEPPLFPPNPQIASPCPGQISPFPGGSGNPAGTWRLPHPPCPSGVLGKLSVLEPGHLGATRPSGKFLLKQGPRRAGAPPAGGYSPHDPISAPPPAPQRPGARPAPLPGALIPGSAAGQGRSHALKEGATVRGPPSRGRAQRAQDCRPRSARTGARRPVGVGPGTAARPGVGAVISMCACVCGGGGQAVCVRGRRR